MNTGKMVLAQIMEFAPAMSFKRIVDKYNGNKGVRDFTCWRQFVFHAFGQLTHRESMSDTNLCLSLNRSKMYHLGMGGVFDTSTISRANEARDWRIFEEFGKKLIEQAKALYFGDNQLDVELKGDIFALDSTTVDLCVDVFGWSNFRETKAAIKIHTLLDLKTSIPDFIFISEGAVHDVNILDQVAFKKGSYYVMDKAYTDFARLYSLRQDKAYFVIRAKENLRYKVVLNRSIDVDAGILVDQEICLMGTSNIKYPERLRRIKYHDKIENRILVFLTNNLSIKAATVTKLYKHRWRVELFFKWIKQHLKIKSFWGQNENAVRIQIWIAISVYVLVAIAKKQMKIQNSLYEMLQYISVSPFEKEPLYEVFKNYKSPQMHDLETNQLKFNLI